jgi:hypothetical protein
MGADREGREVMAGHHEYLADPSKGVPAEAILDRIKARRATRRRERRCASFSLRKPSVRSTGCTRSQRTLPKPLPFSYNCR